MLCRSREGSLSPGWSRERGAGGGAFRAGAARERCAVGFAGAPRGARRTAAVSRPRIHVVVRVLHGGARVLQVVCGSTNRCGARVQEVPGGVCSRGEGRVAALGAVAARSAPESGERGGAVRGVYSQELRAGRATTRGALSQTR